MLQHYLAINQAFRVSPPSFVTRLASLVGILTLLMSPVTAQVNGPGPSPANLFDTVLDLPGDEAVITGVNFESIGGVEGQTAQLNVNDGGRVGRSFDALAGGEVNISGGAVDSGLIANAGSEVNISGGEVGTVFQARDGSAVNITGGFIGHGFQAGEGSAVNISGGSWAGSFKALEGSDVELVGGEFKLNGEAFTESTITIGIDDVFTGTLADGSPFIFSNYFGIGDALSGVRLTPPSVPLLEPSLLPLVVATPVDSGLRGLRAGESLTVLTGGELSSDFQVVDAALHVDGGEVGQNLEVACRGRVNISGGSVASLKAYDASEVNITGGSLGRLGDAGIAIDSMVNISGGTVGSFDVTGGSLNISGGDIFNRISIRGSEANISGGSLNGITAFDGSEVNFSGGDITYSFSALSGSEMNISSGNFGENFVAAPDSVVNISGGVLSQTFHARSGSVVNVRGRSFSIDGAPLDNLQPDQPVTITERDVTLSGVLADGEPFSFNLNSGLQREDLFREDLFEQDATITVTLVSPVILGDVNQDGVVNCDDVDSYRPLLDTSVTVATAALDLDSSGTIDLVDVENLITNLVVTQPNGVTGTFLGDLNCDGKVDVLDDAFTLVSNLNSSAGSYSQGDINFDGNVDVLGDAFIFISNLGRSNTNP